MMRFKNLIACIFLMTIAMKLFAMDYCFNIPGPWSGNAKLIYHMGPRMYRCEYLGKIFMSTPVDDRSHFDGDMNFKLVSGICSPRLKMQFAGICNGATGSFIIKTNDADVTGQLSEDGMSASIEGTLTIPILNVVATVEKLDLYKL
jgi:hypothetical protein